MKHGHEQPVPLCESVRESTGEKHAAHIDGRFACTNLPARNHRFSDKPILLPEEREQQIHEFSASAALRLALERGTRPSPLPCPFYACVRGCVRIMGRSALRAIAHHPQQLSRLAHAALKSLLSYITCPIQKGSGES